MSKESPALGVDASVVVDDHTNEPRRLSYEREGLRRIAARDAADLYGEDGFEPTHEPLLDDLPVVSAYSLHVALYALQNPTPENIHRALYKIGTSGDCEEHTDHETFLPLPVCEPADWDDPHPSGYVGGL